MGKILLVLVTFLVYSTSGVFLKLSSDYDLMSSGFVGCIACCVLFLGIYAGLWQEVLKRMPLSKAFIFKSVSILYTFLFSFFLFSETITAMNIIGAFFIAIGLLALGLKKIL